MKALLSSLGVIAVITLSSIAGAAEAAASDESQKPAEESAADDDFGHGQQFGLRAALVGGYRMVFRYDESPLCREFDTKKSLADQARFCGHGAPLALDLGLSFALLDFVEPFAWARLGLSTETETNTAPIVIVGVGARLYTMSDSRFKIFIEPALAMEFEGEGDEPQYTGGGYDPQYKQDLVFHLAAGPQLDLARAVGIYASGGLTTGILRAIHTSLDLQLGVQLRFP